MNGATLAVVLGGWLLILALLIDRHLERRRWDEERRRLMVRADPGLVLGDPEPAQVRSYGDADEWRIERERLKRQGLLADDDPHDAGEGETE